MENNEVKGTGDHIVAQALETALGSKVEKEDGKGLSSNDYTNTEKEKLAGIPVLDYASLEEQLVPEEFWGGKQVYQRTFKGTVHAAVGGNYIARNCFKSTNTILVDAWGSINGEPTSSLGHNYSIPLGKRWDVDIQDDSLTYVTEFDFMGNMSYTITVKYAQ